jgi:hypothetical protein
MYTPFLINAKYKSKCGCGKEILPGDEVLYFPQARKVECRDCATPTLEALADEEMMGNG